MSRIGWLLALLALGGWDLTQRKNPDVERGNAHFQRGEIDEAIAAYRKALEQLPRAPGVHFDLGTALYSKGMATQPGKERDALLDEAERELRLGTDAEDPKLRSNVHYNLGNALRARERLDEAIQEYKKALKLDPSNGRARHNLELLLRAKQEEKPPPQDQPQARRQDQPDPQPQDRPRPPDQPPDRPEDQERPQDQPQEAPQPSDRPKEAPRPQPSDRPAQPEDDRQWKLDALERLSKEMQIQKQRVRGEQRRGRPTKDW